MRKTGIEMYGLIRINNTGPSIIANTPITKRTTITGGTSLIIFTAEFLILTHFKVETNCLINCPTVFSDRLTFDFSPSDLSDDLRQVSTEEGFL